MTISIIAARNINPPYSVRYDDAPDNGLPNRSIYNHLPNIMANRMSASRMIIMVDTGRTIPNRLRDCEADCVPEDSGVTTVVPPEEQLPTAITFRIH